MEFKPERNRFMLFYGSYQNSILEYNSSDFIINPTNCVTLCHMSITVFPMCTIFAAMSQFGLVYVGPDRGWIR